MDTTPKNTLPIKRKVEMNIDNRPAQKQRIENRGFGESTQCEPTNFKRPKNQRRRVFGQIFTSRNIIKNIFIAKINHQRSAACARLGMRV